MRNALFLILTKFDLEFLEKGGETAESRQGKWDRRLHASLLELYGKDEWVGNWNGRPFANTLFLRNPGMKQKHLMDYQEIVKQADGSERLVEAGPAAASKARDRGVPARLRRLRAGAPSTSSGRRRRGRRRSRRTTAASAFSSSG